MEMPKPDDVNLAVALIKLLAKMSDSDMAVMRGCQAEVLKAGANLRLQMKNLEGLGRDPKTRVAKDSGMGHMYAAASAREGFMKAMAQLIEVLSDLGEVDEVEYFPKTTVTSLDELKNAEVFVEYVAFLTANQTLVLADMTKKLLSDEPAMATSEKSWKRGLSADAGLADVLTAGEEVFKYCNAKDLRNRLAEHEKEWGYLDQSNDVSVVTAG